MSVTKHIDLSIYRENLLKTIATMNPARVMAVVKAEAYGHGLIPISKAAESCGVTLLGTLDIETAIQIRKAGVKTTAFAWLHSPQSDFRKAAELDIELSVSSLSELQNITAATSKAKIHLKLDSGLSRNGCRPENFQELMSAALELQRSGKVQVVAIWTHLSGTSNEHDEEALAVFEKSYQEASQLGFKGYRHAASSPAAFSNPKARYDLVRIGVSAFGTSPISGTMAETFGLASPMRLTAEVHSPGVINIGFLHGLFSSLSKKAHVVISGNKYTILEIGPLASKIENGAYEPGDLVEVFGTREGKTLSAEEVCELAGTVTDELFTGLKTNSVVYSN